MNVKQDLCKTRISAKTGKMVNQPSFLECLRENSFKVVKFYII